MKDWYIYRFEDEGSEWSDLLPTKEACIKCALEEQSEENTDFKNVLIAKVENVEL